MMRLPDIPGIRIVDMRLELDAIRCAYAPDYWRSGEALLAAAALWGIEPPMADELIRNSGTFRYAEDEMLAKIDRCHATVSLIQAPNGLWAMAIHCQTPTQGYGAAPSVWNDNAYHSRDDARLMAVYTLVQWFEGVRTGPHTPSVAEREQACRMVSLLDGYFCISPRKGIFHASGPTRPLKPRGPRVITLRVRPQTARC